MITNADSIGFDVSCLADWHTAIDYTSSNGWVACNYTYVSDFDISFGVVK